VTPDPGLAVDLSRRALDSLPFNTAIVDAEGTIVWTDAAWQDFASDNDMKGRPDTIGTNYLTVSEGSDELGDEAADGLRGVLAGEPEQFTLEYPCHSPDEQRWFMMWVGGFERRGERFATIAHFDITQRVEAEQELAATAEELSEERDQLALLNQVVRHDIRNDVQLIATFSELLEDTLEPDANAESLERLDRIRHQSQHVIELTKSIGDLSTLITGEGDPIFEPVDLATLLRDEVDKLERTYGTEGTDLTVSGVGEVPLEATVLADEMLSSVVGNLLTNAVVHNSGDAVHIDVSLAIEDERIVLTVADDGPGVPPEERRTVFGRGEKGLESPGSGLGLYLVDRLVEAYGGDVWIEDSDLGGAAFRVALPRPA
jgi:signal transduction histidine kinase